MDKMKVLEALNANRGSRKGLRLSTTKTYTVTVDGDLTVVLPPQALQLLGIMYNEEVEEWTEKALFDLFKEHPEVSVKQTTWKVWQYYRAKLVESGFVVESK